MADTTTGRHDNATLYLRGRFRHMHSSEMMQALGLKAGGHLPLDGMPARQIGGVTVYVTPAQPARNGHKSSAHRVMAVCPVCGRHMSAGRLMSQHFPKMRRREEAQAQVQSSTK